uniref:Uncharacterized protein n=1 Tax=Rhizophora mucronata TaxID=61149 RepID=A0A2P2QY04_RHIMU
MAQRIMFDNHLHLSCNHPQVRRRTTIQHDSKIESIKKHQIEI